MRETVFGSGIGDPQISVSNRSDLLAINKTTAFTILICLEQEFLKCRVKDESGHYENSPTI